MSGKSITVCILMLLLFCSLAGCGNTNAGTPNANASTPKNSASNGAQSTAPENTAPIERVAYIGERYVQFNRQDDVFEVQFAFLNESKNYMSVDGEANIRISDVKGNVLYDKAIPFTKADFKDSTNKLRDQSSYVCLIKIPRSDVEGASSSTGTLALSAHGLNYGFDEVNLGINDLPIKNASIVLPEMPVSITDSRFGNTLYSTVSDITYETEINRDGVMRVTLQFVISLDEKVGRESNGDRVLVGFKLTDSEGFVVESVNISTGSLNVGDRTKEKTTIFGLDSSETYTLTIENPS